MYVVYFFIFIYIFISLPLALYFFLNFLCNSAFEQGHLEPWRYINAFIIIIIILVHLYHGRIYCAFISSFHCSTVNM